MAESFSVKASLSAVDSGFSSTLRNAISAVGTLGEKIKGGLGFGVLSGVGQQAFSAITNGASGLISEINSSNAAWKTFESNLSMLDWDSGSISSAKKELQDFAQKTVYSSSDMATTFAQLAAVGVDDTSQLVQAFGGLAAAAENPQQAMKTLSQQATQMAAKPNVAWADFKLMLEQTPAGIAAVAREMGMSTSELVTAVQDGKIKTEDFFNAIKKAGGAGTELAKLATEAKTVGQAMDGLKETIGNKLTPAFDVLSDIGIKAVEGITDKLSKIDGDAIASKVTGWIKKAQPYWTSFQNAVSKVWAVVSGVANKLSPIFEALGSKVASAVKTILDKIGSIDANAIVDKLCGWAQKAQPYFDLFQSAISTVASAISAAIPYVLAFAEAIGGFLLDNAETICNVIAKATPIVLGLVVAFKGYKIISSLVPGMTSFAKSIASMASGGIKGLASKLFGVAAGQQATGKAAAASSKQMLASAKAFMMIGAGVLMVAAGFALLAQSAIALSNAGGLAIGVMAGLVVAVAGLTIGMMAMMKTITASPAKLTAMATAMLALGAAVVLVSAGFALLAYSAISLANAGPVAIGVMVGLVAAIALLAWGAAALGSALTAGAVGFVAFGAAIALVGVGALLAAAGVSILTTSLPSIISYGIQGAEALTALSLGMTAFAVGAALAGAACTVLGAGLTTVAIGIGLVSVAIVVVAAGVLLLAGGVVALSAGVLLLGASLSLVTIALAGISVLLPATAAGTLLVVAAFTLLLGMATALGTILLIVSVSMAAFGIATAASGIAVAAFGLAMAASAVGVLVMASGLVAVQSAMKSIASNAKKAEKSLDSMQDSVDVVQSGLDALGDKAKSAMDKLTSVFDKTASDTKSAGKKVGTGFTQGMESGLATAPSAAISSVVVVNTALLAGEASAYRAGAYIGQGFAQGMLSQIAVIESAAARMAAAADKAVCAKAKIHSPSKVSTKDGQFWGQGLANGILDKVRVVRNAAEKLVSIPNIAAPKIAVAYGGEMSADYDYYRNSQYTIDIPLTLDGKVVARATASYTQDELDKRQKRDSRKQGRV